VANKGSLARDILATERTFLAWARTGLGFVGAGSALAAAYHRQDQRLAPAILPASALLMGNGAFLLLFATRRYYTVLEALRRDKFVINTFDTLFAVGLTSVTTVASLAIVWRAEFLKGPRKTSSKSSRRRKEKRSSSSSSSSSSSETPSESSSDAEGPSR
jgi:uncharacterized membrane protein YidH (DUF202 family)